MGRAVADFDLPPEKIKEETQTVKMRDTGNVTTTSCRLEENRTNRRSKIVVSIRRRRYRSVLCGVRIYLLLFITIRILFGSI